MQDKELFELPLAITPGLCDYSGRLSHQEAFRLFMDAASIHAEMLGVGLKKMAEKGLFWLTVKTRINFESRPSLGEQVVIESWPHAPVGKRCLRSYSLKRNGKEIITGKTEWAVINTRTGWTVDIDVFSEDLRYDREESCPQPFCHIDTSFSGSEETEYVVSMTDIDVGGHMNNAAYVHATMNTFSVEEMKSMKITDIEAIFLGMCFEKDRIVIQKKKNGNNTDVRWLKNDEPVFLARIILKEQ